MQKGNIGVTTENIFPVIKKFLYSDHEIFLREIVSNAIDATQKLKTLHEKGEFKGELGSPRVRVTLGSDTITVSDNGIGLTAEEIENTVYEFVYKMFDTCLKINLKHKQLQYIICHGILSLQKLLAAIAVYLLIMAG